MMPAVVHMLEMHKNELKGSKRAGVLDIVLENA